jgi:NADPH:quinone reductase-like Zn-dependent oxidoreductase
MKAIVVEQYGRFEEQEVPKPTPAGGEVLVRVRASSVNALEWYMLSGRPWLARPMTGIRRPRSTELGSDFAGVVEAVGDGVAGLEVGDEVYGSRHGALAEYVVATAVERKPVSLSLEEAAAVPVAALSALQGLRDHGALQPGQRVLVNGAAGGVGTFAVQIAAALGAEVHAVCSVRNVQQSEALGAARVFDYAREDFSRSGERYDVVLDVAGNRSWRSMRRVLAPDGAVVLVGGPRGRRLVGPLGHVVRVLLAAKLARRRATFFVAKPNRDDLAALAELIDAGHVRPVIERRYELRELDEAMEAMRSGHARGKHVVAVTS